MRVSSGLGRGDREESVFAINVGREATKRPDSAEIGAGIGMNTASGRLAGA